MIRFRLSLGAITVEVEGDRVQDVIKESVFFAELPKKCSVCDSPWFFTHRKPKGVKGEFFSLRCTGPTPHQLDLSQHTDDNGGGLYLDRKKAKWAIPPTAAASEPAEPRPLGRATPESSQPPQPQAALPNTNGATYRCSQEKCNRTLTKQQHDATVLGPWRVPLCQPCAKLIRPANGGRR